MIDFLLHRYVRQAELEMEHNLRAAFAAQQRARDQAAELAEIDRYYYGRDAIDVEAREIKDVPLLEKKP